LFLNAWFCWFGMEVKTLVFVVDVDHRQVLLGLKKRGFGRGKWNGFGGKLNPGESTVKAAVREVFEESSLVVALESLVPAGEVVFLTKDRPEFATRVEVFVAFAWTGTPTESEEMVPQWFPLDRLPFESMWPADPLWLPLIFEGQTVSGTVVFSKDDNSVLDYSFDFEGPSR